MDIKERAKEIKKEMFAKGFTVKTRASKNQYIKVTVLTQHTDDMIQELKKALKKYEGHFPAGCCPEDERPWEGDKIVVVRLNGYEDHFL